MAAVLIVDDHVDSSRVLARLIPGHAQPVECVGEPQEALALSRQCAAEVDRARPDDAGHERDRAFAETAGDDGSIMFRSWSSRHSPIRPTADRVGCRAQEFVIKGQVEEAIATLSKYLRATGPGK